jgi:xanthine dehydrogenase YagT iron-sulfur-binding subunit
MFENHHPLGVGHAAPDVVLAAPVGDTNARTLRALRGRTVLLVLTPSRWDPARDELAALYAVERSARPLVVADDRSATARAFGVHDATALFVVDETGMIRWRWVEGIDVVPQSSVDDLDAEPLGEGRPPLAMSRRDFVQVAVAAAAVLAVVLAPRAVRAAGLSPERDGATLAGPTAVTLNVNGRPINLELEPRVTLLDALRERAGLTGTKKGCDHGQCGACTVHVDGRRVLSCMTFAVMVPPAARITTIEGLAQGDVLHPMQQAFITHDGFQCGYCTSGQIMSATAVVNEPWGSSDDAMREAMSGNICRCGAYPGIVAAVQSVRGKQEAAR